MSSVLVLTCLWFRIRHQLKLLVGGGGISGTLVSAESPWSLYHSSVHQILVCRCNVGVLCVSVSTEEYNTSIQEKLPLIIGSAAAGLVFLIALVVIIIVCNRYVNGAHQFTGWLFFVVK